MATGLDEILSNLSAIRYPGAAALATAGLLVKRESQLITPVDTANLIGSCYVSEVVGSANGILSIEIGYQAAYAPFVHEMPTSTNWQKPTAENKFLEKALLKSKDAVNQILSSTLGMSVGSSFTKGD